MSIIVRNKTADTLKLKDYYVWDSAGNVGIYGGVEYVISAGGREMISSTIFTEKLMQHLKPQQIHFKRGEDTLLVLNHEDFENNRDRELVLEMGDEGLRHEFVDRRGRILFQRIRDMLPFRGA